MSRFTFIQHGSRRILGILAAAALFGCGNEPAFQVSEGTPLAEMPGEGTSFLAAMLPAKPKQSAARKATVPSPYGQDPSRYGLTFAEEFNNGFDYRFWNDHIWYERSHPIRNFAVENGVLKIWPERDEKGEFVKRTLDTDGKFEQAYGYFEMEAKLPKGKGLWPAFWLFAHPGNRRPEIDIMEAYPGGVEPWGFPGKDGIPRPRAYGITVWLDEKIKAGFLQHDSGVDLSEKFHKYAVKWEPNQQTFYFDGKEVYRIKVNMPDPKYILLDLWYGSASGEPDSSTPLGKRNSFEVNYVRAWQFRE